MLTDDAVLIDEREKAEWVRTIRGIVTLWASWKRAAVLDRGVVRWPHVDAAFTAAIGTSPMGLNASERVAVAVLLAESARARVGGGGEVALPERDTIPDLVAALCQLAYHEAKGGNHDRWEHVQEQIVGKGVGQFEDDLEEARNQRAMGAGDE
jgi:hypothetical protein